MSVQVWIVDEAEQEARAARAWWESNRQAAPDLFRRELQAVLELLAELPESGHPHPHPEVPGLRRALMSRTRYHIYYVYHAESELLVVLSVWSGLRGSEPALQDRRR